MCQMKRFLFHSLPFYLVFNVSSLCAQSPGYTIESFQGSYTELSSYQSIGILTQGDPLWEYEFQLEFPFPFYDSTYSRMFYNQNAWGSFTEDQDVALFLFQAPWTYEHIVDTSNITSDVRFAHVEAGDRQAFVIQFTKARFFADPFEDSLDTYVNFQLWFYDNGIMEVHFGEINMDGNPIYEPGVGFYDYTTSGGVDTTYVAGPHMGISHPLNEKDAIGLEGAYNDFEIVGELYSNLTLLPPEGWIIRFKPIEVSTTGHSVHYEVFQVCPNPTNSTIWLPADDVSVFVFNGIGETVYSGNPKDHKLDISSFRAGIYYLHIDSGDKILTGKFIKQ